MSDTSFVIQGFALWPRLEKPDEVRRLSDGRQVGDGKYKVHTIVNPDQLPVVKKAIAAALKAVGLTPEAVKASVGKKVRPTAQVREEYEKVAPGSYVVGPLRNGFPVTVGRVLGGKIVIAQPGEVKAGAPIAVSARADAFKTSAVGPGIRFWLNQVLILPGEGIRLPGDTLGRMAEVFGGLIPAAVDELPADLADDDVPF